MLSSETPVSSHLRSGAWPAQPLTLVDPPSLSDKLKPPVSCTALEDFPNPNTEVLVQTVGLFPRTLTPQAKYPWCLGVRMRRRSLGLLFISMCWFLSLFHAEVTGDFGTFLLLLSCPACSVVINHWEGHFRMCGRWHIWSRIKWKFLVWWEWRKIKVSNEIWLFLSTSAYFLFSLLFFCPLPEKQHRVMGMCTGCQAGHCEFESQPCYLACLFLGFFIYKMSPITVSTLKSCWEAQNGCNI